MAFFFLEFKVSGVISQTKDPVTRVTVGSQMPTAILAVQDPGQSVYHLTIIRMITKYVQVIKRRIQSSESNSQSMFTLAVDNQPHGYKP